MRDFIESQEVSYVMRCAEIAQMVERQTVEPNASGSNRAAGKFFHAILQYVTRDRVYRSLSIIWQAAAWI